MKPQKININELYSKVHGDNTPKPLQESEVGKFYSPINAPKSKEVRIVDGKFSLVDSLKATNQRNESTETDGMLTESSTIDEGLSPTIKKDGDTVYADTDFVQQSSDYGSLEHAGYGDFKVKTKDGVVEFRRYGDRIAGFNGRTHIVKGDPKAIASMIKSMKPKVLKESTITESNYADMIANLSGTRASAVKKFVDDNNIDEVELLKYLSKGSLSDKMNFMTAIAGKPGNKQQKMIIGRFGLKESTINEQHDSLKNPKPKVGQRWKDEKGNVFWIKDIDTKAKVITTDNKKGKLSSVQHDPFHMWNNLVKQGAVKLDESVNETHWINPQSKQKFAKSMNVKTNDVEYDGFDRKAKNGIVTGYAYLPNEERSYMLTVDAKTGVIKDYVKESLNEEKKARKNWWKKFNKQDLPKIKNAEKKDGLWMVHVPKPNSDKYLIGSGKTKSMAYEDALSKAYQSDVTGWMNESLNEDLTIPKMKDLLK